MTDEELHEHLSQTFEWDPAKARKNYMSHRVMFTEAATVFFDEHAVYYKDEEHSNDEERYIVIGRSQRDRRLFVVHVYRGVRVRLISARAVSPSERSVYEAELGR